MKKSVTKDRLAPRLRHDYVAGLRFDTEVQILRNGRWCDLFALIEGNAEDHFGECLAQCLETLRLPSAPLPPGTAARWDESVQSGKLGHLHAWLKCQEIPVRIEAPTCLSPIDIGIAALQAIDAGAVGMLRLADGHSNHWALLTGIELRQSRPRSLLVLDPRIARPWACGYNARLRLRSTTAGLLYRALDGERHTVVVQQLLILRCV